VDRHPGPRQCRRDEDAGEGGERLREGRLREGHEPCVVFWEHPERDDFLRRLEVRDVWGIGRQWSRKLEWFGYPFAYDLVTATTTGSGSS
jgi:hypothetical protein